MTIQELAKVMQVYMGCKLDNHLEWSFLSTFIKLDGKIISSSLDRQQQLLNTEGFFKVPIIQLMHWGALGGLMLSNELNGCSLMMLKNLNLHIDGDSVHPKETLQGQKD